MSTSTTVNRDLSNLRLSAEKMHAAETERIGTASPGDVVRQGDLYIVALAEPEHGAETNERQLAPGTTQGSRHVASGDCVIRAERSEQLTALYPDVPSELIGPSIECRGDTTVTHPEHGDKVLPAGSNWAVVYQRAYADEILRVQD